MLASTFRRLMPTRSSSDTSAVDLEVVARPELRDALEQGVVFDRIAVAQVAGDADRVRNAPDAGMGQDRLDFRREDQLPLHARVKERLDSDAVPHDVGLVRTPVVHGEGEHPDETLQAFDPVLEEAVEHYFGVGLGAERVAALDQLLPKLTVVVDLTVEHEHRSVLRVGHGLAAFVREIDDLEPPVAERDALVDESARLIRPTVPY